MARYILIENASGWIWGDSADLEGNGFDGTALEFAAALDKHVGTHEERFYEDVSRYALAANETGYHVYKADLDVIPIVNDGQDKNLIEQVVSKASYVTTIRISSADELL